MAMSWTHRFPLPHFEDYLQQRLKGKSFIIKRHEFCTTTLSDSFTSSNWNKNQLIKDIASKPNEWWVIFDPKEVRTVKNTFKNNGFKCWCQLTNHSDGDSHFTSGMWGTFPK